MPALFFCLLLQSGGNNPSYTILARLITTSIMRAATRTNETRSRLDVNEEMVASIMPRLVEKYALNDIFTMDVTSLAFRRSPVATKADESTISSSGLLP